MITEQALKAANEAGREQLKNGPVAESAHYDKRTHRLVIVLKSGIEIGFAPHCAQGLENAKPADLDEIEISPSGLGVHFPKLDADIYLPSLVQGFLGNEGWAASKLGQQGGKARSEKKSSAARANGAKGGRPSVNKKTYA